MFCIHTNTKHINKKVKEKKGSLADASLINYKKIQEGNLAPQAFKNILKDQNHWQERFWGGKC